MEPSAFTAVAAGQIGEIGIITSFRGGDAEEVEAVGDDPLDGVIELQAGGGTGRLRVLGNLKALRASSSPRVSGSVRAIGTTRSTLYHL